MSFHFGVPNELHSDQCNFESQVFNEVCRLLGVKKLRTTSLGLQGDGLMERFNCILSIQLLILVSHPQRDWDRYLPLALCTYCTSVQDASNYIPAALMFVREHRTPVDLVFGAPLNPTFLGVLKQTISKGLERGVHDYTTG